MNAVNLEETGLHEPEVLRRLVDIIVREADPEAIILFGSRARGDARADSDIDLLVIEREPFSSTRSRIKEAARLYRALGDLPASKDLLLYSRDEVNHPAEHVKPCRCARLSRRAAVVWRPLSTRHPYSKWPAGTMTRWRPQSICRRSRTRSTARPLHSLRGSSPLRGR